MKTNWNGEGARPHEFYYILPSAYEAWGNIMFSLASDILPTGAGGYLPTIPSGRQNLYR